MTFGDSMAVPTLRNKSAKDPTSTTRVRSCVTKSSPNLGIGLLSFRRIVFHGVLADRLRTEHPLQIPERYGLKVNYVVEAARKGSALKAAAKLTLQKVFF